MENLQDSIMNPKGGIQIPSLCYLPLGLGAWDVFYKIIQKKQHIQKRADFFILLKTEKYSCIGPILSSPVAVMALEKVVACGAKNIFAFGWAGSLQEKCKIGDILLVSSALSEEGTSPLYNPEEKQPQAGTEAYHCYKQILMDSHVTFQEGAVWTTDAPYRETRQKVFDYQKKNICAVEMEISAIYTVGKFRNVSVAASVVISDEVFHPKWKAGFHHPKFQETCQTVAQIFCNI